VASLNTYLIEHIGQVEGHQLWLAILALVKNLSDVLVNSLPVFWKVAKGFIDGSLKKVRIIPMILRRSYY
jgi:exocyst complex component 2